MRKKMSNDKALSYEHGRNDQRFLTLYNTPENRKGLKASIFKYKSSFKVSEDKKIIFPL